jgi:threonine/homoserine/homoserine lactone efflux protein
MSGDRVLAFAALAAVIIAVPGPSVLFVVGRAVAYGRRAALLTVLGNAAGVGVVVLLVAVGLGAVVARSATLFTVIKLAGALYLIWLGIDAIRHSRSMASALARAPSGPRPGHHVMREGFVVGLLNPKTAVFFAAVLPQFIDPAAAHPSVQMTMLGAVFLLIALVFDSIWGLSAAQARVWLGRDRRRLERLGVLGGVVMIGLGTFLALEDAPAPAAARS